jgi:thiamine pyrophosphate-dependent acetolactate synthase large subunit-like protein
MLTPTSRAVPAPRRGAEMLLETLRSEGVEYIFGNPGTTELALMDALVDMPEIHYVLALQEASAVAMADGYAQATGRPGFLNLHTAGGLGNGMGNLLNASVSQTPLVVTAGQQDSRHSLTDPLLSGDLVRIAAPAVKWAHEVTDVAQIPVLIRRAFNDARAAPTGPVFLSLPMDIMEAMTDIGITEHSVVDRCGIAGSLDRLAECLAAVAPGRLAIIAGDEIHASGAADEVVGLAETLGAPVYGSSWPARIPYPTAHPLWAGNLPTNASDIARAAAITPLVAAQQAVRAIGPDVAIVDEAIATSLHVRSFLDSASARQYSFLRGGGLGWGMPAAIGCSLGLGREPVVSLVGDGAALYSPQALWTAAHERLPVTFVVMNNRKYNILKNYMRSKTEYASVRSNRFIAMDLVDPAIDFLSLARAMGVPGRRIERASDIAPAIEAGIASRTPNLIEIMIGTE